MAPRAISVICQPAMPVLAAWEVVDGTSPKRAVSYPVPGGGTETSLAKAAGMVAAEASRPMVTAARAAASAGASGCPPWALPCADEFPGG